MRRSRQSSQKKGTGRIVDAAPISERLPSIEDRAIPGHWETDLMGSSNNSYFATLVERKTRYIKLAKSHYETPAERIETCIAVIG